MVLNFMARVFHPPATAKSSRPVPSTASVARAEVQIQLLSTSQHQGRARRFLAQLCRNARRSLQAEQLRPALACAEAKTRPGSTQSPAQIRSRVEYLS